MFRLVALSLLVASLPACKNADYENCLKREKESLEKLAKAMDACDRGDGDEAAKAECKKTAQAGHFEAGCDALK